MPETTEQLLDRIKVLHQAMAEQRAAHKDEKAAWLNGMAEKNEIGRRDEAIRDLQGHTDALRNDLTVCRRSNLEKDDELEKLRAALDNERKVRKADRAQLNAKASKLQAMEDKLRSKSPLKDLASTACLVGVPQRWLREEAKGGRVPCLRVGKDLMFHVESVTESLIARAKGTGSQKAD